MLLKKNAAPIGAACKPQYALFRYFLQKTNENDQSACLRKKAGMS